MKKITIILLLTSLLSAIYASTIEIYPQVSANILKIHNVGATIKKGDTLVKLDDSQIKNKISQMQAMVNYKRLLLDDALKVLNEENELYENTVSKKQTLDLAKLEVKKAQFNYKAQVAQLNYYKNEQQKYIIKAPWDCIILQIINPRDTTNIYNGNALLKIKSK
jgi:multidrug efflux pump subunit AcrA (membrane-fusion protein)